MPAFIRSSSSPTPREFRLRRNRHATKARPPTRTAPPTPTTTPMMIRLDESLRPEEARPPLLSLLRPGAGDWPGVMVEAEVCSKVLPLMVMVLVTMTTEDCVGWGELVRGGGVVRFVVLVGVSELVVLGGGSFVLEVVGFSGSEVVGGSGVELEVEEVVVVVGSSVGDGEAVCDSSTLTTCLFLPLFEFSAPATAMARRRAESSKREKECVHRIVAGGSDWRTKWLEEQGGVTRNPPRQEPSNHRNIGREFWIRRCPYT